MNNSTSNRFKKVLNITFIIFLICALSILSVTVLPMFLALSSQSALRAPTFQQTERFFEENKEKFIIIAEYLTNLELYNIGVSWDSPGIVETTSNYVQLSIFREPERITVSNENASEAIHALFGASYNGIWKYEHGITFTRWFMRDHSRGIVYSIDGRIPDSDTILFLTELHPLSEENWFFFIENFSEYRQGIRPD